MRSLSAADIARLLPMPDAIAVAAEAFAAISRGTGRYPQRTHFPLADGDALVMPGYDGAAYLGTKIVVVRQAAGEGPGTTACYLLLTAADAQPVLLCDGTALTALRTAAASGLATRRLAREDATVLALFGAGGQAAEQMAAMFAVRPIGEVRVVSRNAERANRFIARMRERFPAAQIDRSDARAALAGAGIVVTATNSSTPVFDGAWVEPGTHVNAIGSYRPEMRELDAALLRRARVIVDQREAAVAEAGELIDAIAQGVLTRDSLVELGEIAEGARQSASEITVFKTVGHAALDLHSAVALLGRT
jgi:ornithine cyclodeaminase/alanine dehydrogenase-like protein (mu-crystallin family)